jgi:hypothetical protein
MLVASHIAHNAMVEQQINPNLAGTPQEKVTVVDAAVTAILSGDSRTMWLESRARS